MRACNTDANCHAIAWVPLYNEREVLSMSEYHQQLAAGRWQQFSLVTQLANIGSEVERAIKWKQKGNDEYFQRAFERMLELIDLTVADPKNRKRLKEVLCAREKCWWIFSCMTITITPQPSNRRTILRNLRCSSNRQRAAARAGHPGAHSGAHAVE